MRIVHLEAIPLHHRQLHLRPKGQEAIKTTTEIPRRIIETHTECTHIRGQMRTEVEKGGSTQRKEGVTPEKINSNNEK